MIKKPNAETTPLLLAARTVGWISFGLLLLFFIRRNKAFLWAAVFASIGAYALYIIRAKQRGRSLSLKQEVSSRYAAGTIIAILVYVLLIAVFVYFRIRLH